ncbi:hypothetical protein [Bradyrhizobium sp. USDA 4454]
MPNIIITFADGAYGWIAGSDVLSAINSRIWNSGSTKAEYGQLYQMPFPMKVCGIYCWAAPSGDFTLNLYSDPLGTPVAQKSVTLTQKTIVLNSTPGVIYIEFPTPYSATANQPLGAVMTPGAGNITGYYKTLGSAGHRASDPWGTSGYGISRSTGAFANANSSLDHYYIGLLVSAFDDAAGGGGGGSGGGYVIGS